MNIDQKTLDVYKNNTSKFWCSLKKGINFRKAKFKVDKNKRCAFLNDKNLCDIIINLGEESLCQVCRDHPRFRSFFNDRIEMGLGFCCEQATRIILNFPDKIEQILVSEDNLGEQLDYNQKNVLEFRKKVLDIIQDRTRPINDRIQDLLIECRFCFNDKQQKSFIKTLLSLERVDKSWSKKIKTLKTKPFITKTNEEFCLVAEQFIVNSLYRHLSDAEDTMWVRARAISTVISWWIIINVADQNLEQIFDTVRAYSVEIEYSQKNLNKIYDYSYKLIKI